jgi:hypothetical protein
MVSHLLDEWGFIHFGGGLPSLAYHPTRNCRRLHLAPSPPSHLYIPGDAMTPRRSWWLFAPLPRVMH